VTLQTIAAKSRKYDRQPGDERSREDEQGQGSLHGHDEGHSHGLVDRSIVRSRAGVAAVGKSLAALCLTAGAQVAVFALSGSVALLADLIHNFGDALTALPLGVAFFLRSYRGEKLAGLAVVLAIFVSACVALYETIMRFIEPQHLTHLWALAGAGAIGFIGNEVAYALARDSRAPRSSLTATTPASTVSFPSAWLAVPPSSRSEPSSLTR
jgi:Co/Zn/Cd efflux system component